MKQLTNQLKLNQFLTFFLLSILIVNSTFSQVPNKISYQAIIRDASQNLIREKPIGIEISILSGSIDGEVMYNETLSTQSNSNGLISIEFGGIGFSLIDWSNGPYFLKVGIDVNGGNNYSLESTSQLLSVPFAIYATMADTLTSTYVSIEEDPFFQNSIAANISEIDMLEWDTAFSWGDHSGLYHSQDWIPEWEEILNKPQKIHDFELDAGDKAISNVASPIDPHDAVNKEYVDMLIARIEYLEAYLGFDTLFTIPTIVIDSIFSIGSYQVSANATITDNGGAEILLGSGFLWSTLENPDLNSYEGIIYCKPESDSFSATITNLEPSKTYFIRAFVSNHSGTGYSDQMEFATSDIEDLVFDIHNNAYNTVTINGVRWMAENLRVTKYNNGDDIPKLVESYAWSSTPSGAYAVYPHDEFEGIESESDMFNIYGPLYNWMAVDDPRGLCPIGWRLPTDQEWQEFEIYLGMDPSHTSEIGWRGTKEGGDLKSIRTMPDPHPSWLSQNFLAQDLYNYSGIPAGFRHTDGSYYNLQIGLSWWTSSSNNLGSAYYRSLKYDKGTIGRFVGYNNYGFSVRCVKSDSGNLD